MSLCNTHTPRIDNTHTHKPSMHTHTHKHTTHAHTSVMSSVSSASPSNLLQWVKKRLSDVWRCSLVIGNNRELIYSFACPHSWILPHSKWIYLTAPHSKWTYLTAWPGVWTRRMLASETSPALRFGSSHCAKNLKTGTNCERFLVCLFLSIPPSVPLFLYIYPL